MPAWDGPPAPPTPGRSRRWLVVTGIVTVVAVAVAVAVAGLVLANRSSSGNDGASAPATDRSDGPRGWTLKDGVSSGALAVDDERVCGISLYDLLYCLDAASGDEIFRIQLETGNLRSPTLAGDRVLAATMPRSNDALTAYSLDGRVLWEAPHGTLAEAPLPVAGGVVTLVDHDELVAVDVATGEERWSLYPGGEPTDPHVSGDDTFTDGERIYVSVEQFDAATGDAAGNIVALDPATGEEIWRSAPMGDIAFGSGIIDLVPFADGSALAFQVRGFPGRMVVLDAATGALRWDVRFESGYAHIAHVDGTTLVADGNKTAAYDQAGDERWAVRSPDTADDPDPLDPGALVVEDGRVFMLGFDLYELDPDTGDSELIRRSALADDVEIVGEHLIYAGSDELVALPLFRVGD